MSEGLWELPDEWVWQRFGNVAQVDSNLVDPCASPDLPHIAPNHMESGTGRLLPYATVRDDGVTSAKHRFRPGHIIYSKIRPYLAKAVMVDFEGVCSADCYPISTQLEPRYLHRWLVSPAFTEQASNSQGRTLLPKINQKELAELLIPVPPPAEQDRIADRLDDLLARARRAREALADVPTLLDQLRQSLLAAAFRGDLTAEWREAHPDAEPAAVLLERIRAERRRRYEEANPRKRYVPPAPVDAEAEGLPELPAGWEWATLEEMLHDLRNGVSTKPAEDLGLPILRISAVRPLEVNLSDTRFLPAGFAGGSFALSDGDLLFTRYNGNAELVGACGVVHGVAGTVVYPDKLIRGRVVLLVPEFVAQMMATQHLRGQIQRASKTAAGQVGISGKDLKAIRIPIAPLDEQVEITRRVEADLAAVRAVEREAVEMLEEIEALERATLAKAFRGGLATPAKAVEGPPKPRPAASGVGAGPMA